MGEAAVTKRDIWLDLRIMYTWELMLAAVAAWVGMAALWGANAAGAPPHIRLRSAGAFLELGCPLWMAACLAPVATAEPEEHASELVNSYPGAGWRLLVRRCLLAAGVGLAGVAAAALALRSTLGLPLERGLVTGALPPALLLGTVALWGGVLGRSYAVAAGAALAYWGAEWFLRGRLTGRMFLFMRTFPCSAIACNYDLTQNRFLLLAVAALLLVVTLTLSERRERYV